MRFSETVVAAVSAAHSPEKLRDRNLHSVKPLSLHENRNHQLSFSQLADLGVRRISVDSGLALAAWGAFLRAAQDIKTNGTFNLLANNVASADLNELFQEESRRG